ncbi:MAG: NAD+ synthase [Methanosarcinales archaeon]|nr:NAD+ synthase [Methanosarcinales archaeon]
MDTMPDFDPEEAAKKITDFIRSYVNKSGTKGAVIGLSGGIDSAVATYLAVRALGRENVLAITMPESSLTPAEDVLDATDMANILNIDFSVVDISETLNSFIISIPEMVEDDRMSLGNLKARIRMCTLYYYANMMERIVVGTGNRTELLLGYFTKYGDGGVDIEPLGNLFKTQVRELAQYLDVPRHIINKPPTAGLWPGQTDEKELGLTYEEIDNALVALLDKKESLEFVVNRYGIKEVVIVDMLARIDKNIHKCQPAPTPPK